MLQSIKIKNFQSLHDVKLEFGKLTVIVGASSSGKSALIRALKAVSSNKLDADYITQGTKKSAISLTTDNGTVTIEREANGSSSYKVIKNGRQEPSFTKLNRQVPTQVTEVLGITPWDKEVGSINFASQFDPPYLLKDSAGNVARILGELTNVSTIFAAVKEANRKVKNFSTTLNLRNKDMERIVSQISNYAQVGKQSQLVSSAEATLSHAKELQSKLTRLNLLADDLEQSLKVLSLKTDYVALPDIKPALAVQIKFERFTELLSILSIATKNVNSAQTSLAKTKIQMQAAETQLHQYLDSIDRCPLCKREM